MALENRCDHKNDAQISLRCPDQQYIYIYIYIYLIYIAEGWDGHHVYRKSVDAARKTKQHALKWDVVTKSTTQHTSSKKRQDNTLWGGERIVKYGQDRASRKST